VRVLLVDDSLPVRARLLGMLAESPGLAIAEARDAEEAVTVLAGTPVDVVILDLQLGKGHGLAVLSRIKAQDPGIVVIVLTNHSSDQHRRECVARGADYFLDKSRDFARAVQLTLATAR